MNKKVIINAVLAGLWVAAGILTASNQPLDKAVLYGALAAGLRFAVGMIAANVKAVPTIPVDQ